MNLIVDQIGKSTLSRIISLFAKYSTLNRIFIFFKFCGSLTDISENLMRRHWIISILVEILIEKSKYQYYFPISAFDEMCNSN